MKMKAEIRVMLLEQRSARDCQQPTKSQARGMEQILPHSPQKEPHLDLGLLASRTVREGISVKHCPPHLWPFAAAAPETRIAGESLPWAAGGLDLGSQWEVGESSWEGRVLVKYLSVLPF